MTFTSLWTAPDARHPGTSPVWLCSLALGVCQCNTESRRNGGEFTGAFAYVIEYAPTEKTSFPSAPSSHSPSPPASPTSLPRWWSRWHERVGAEEFPSFWQYLARRDRQPRAFSTRAVPARHRRRHDRDRYRSPHARTVPHKGTSHSISSNVQPRVHGIRHHPAFIRTWLVASSGNNLSPAIYLVAICIMVFIARSKLPETSKESLAFSLKGSKNCYRPWPRNSQIPAAKMHELQPECSCCT